MKKILLTGGAGYIGTHTAISLLERGYEVVIIDSFINSFSKTIKKITNICKKDNNINKSLLKIFKVDLRNKKDIEEIFYESKKEKRPIDGVIHLAGLKAVGESVLNPLKYWDFNVFSTLNLLKVMNDNSCRIIIFSSSATIYGHVNSDSISENNSINPINPYGSTKVSIEMMLSDLYQSKIDEWKMISLRYFNPIGSHPSGLIGENPFGKPNNIFPIITGVASGRYKKLSIFGNDWDTPDGTGIRDYIHVVDLAEGHVSALEHLFKNKSKNMNLNLGTGKGTSVLELIRTFEKVNNVEVPFDYVERRKGDLSRVVANNEQAINLLGWYPKRSLEDMCKDGWRSELKREK